jgi:predicted CXXCH cytochrome family protein
MHNSQDGAPMTYDGLGPYEYLLRGDCLGCHAQNTAQNIVDGTPQVQHTGAVDLAGGNFGYILGTKGSGASDAKGHNVIDFGNLEDVLTDYAPPGHFHPEKFKENFYTNFTCAGDYGCHGIRTKQNDPTGLPALDGAHHVNVNGKLDIADNVNNSYRFLWGTKGFEDSDWQATASASDHNEYFGATTPMSGDKCDNCHYGTNNEIGPANNTISGFCSTCHWDFHSVEGIGGNISSPFLRHPTDVVLPSTGEYAGYTIYSIEAPVARTTVYDAPSSTVTPGTDAVMCLSCHVAHASDYPDMLRWDYSAMIVGGGGSGGCFTCHTEKNQ